MKSSQQFLRALRRLNDLQAPGAPGWVLSLSPREKLLAILHARQGVPTAILGHHDRMIAKGRRSLGLVREEACGECGYPASFLPADRDLGVCGHCGVFLDFSAAKRRLLRRRTAPGKGAGARLRGGKSQPSRTSRENRPAEIF